MNELEVMTKLIPAIMEIDGGCGPCIHSFVVDALEILGLSAFDFVEILNRSQSDLKFFIDTDGEIDYKY